MRYRKLSADGDMVFGGGQAAFWRDQAEAVAQAVETRLRLEVGTWFLDTAAGTDWRGRILGHGTRATRDLELIQRITETQGVTAVESFVGTLDAATRRYTVSATITTAYGPASVSLTV